MDPLILVIIAVIVIVAVVAVALAMRNSRRKAALHQRFGPEYDRVLDRSSSRREAHDQLNAVAERRDSLDIQDLDPQRRTEYREQWHQVQARFVDEPVPAVESADELVTAVMRERGYPVEDFDEQSALVAADHPHVVEHYREARAAHHRNAGAGGGDTEDLRQSFVHYRELFEVLVGRDADPSETPRGATRFETPG